MLEDRPPYGVGDWKRGPVTSPPVVSSFPVSSGLPRWLRQRICLSVQETQETRVRSLGGEDPLEEGRAIHSSILA